VLLLSFVTPAYKIFHSLRWFRIPEAWVEMALLVYRYTFALLDHAADIAAAQRTRLGYSTLPRSLASMGVLAGAVVTRSLDQALRTYEAMVLRGYRGGLSLPPLPDMSRKNWRLLVVILPPIAIFYFAQEWWWK
jgi:cobalt/nickel transport system permease protein